MACFAWPFFLASFRSGEMSSNAGGLPLWPVKFLLPFGLALLLLQGVAELIKRIAGLRGDRRRGRPSTSGRCSDRDAGRAPCSNTATWRRRCSPG